MSSKTTRWIILAVGIILIILAFFMSDVISGNRTFFVEWDLYSITGSPDAKKLRILEVNATATNVIKVWSDSVALHLTAHQFTIQDDDQLHYFVMTAVDTAGNESVYSNIAILDLARPVTVFGVHIR